MEQGIGSVDVLQILKLEWKTSISEAQNTFREEDYFRRLFKIHQKMKVILKYSLS